jgi:glycosyltransferase involved in cell wall biosynthesis
MTRVPAVATVRDHLALCRYGARREECDRQPPGCGLSTYRQCVRDHLARYLPETGAGARSLQHAAAVYHRLDTGWKQLALRRLAAVIAPSRELHRSYRVRGALPARSAIIPNALPPTDTAPAQRAPRRATAARLLFAGRLSWGKGPGLLLEALPAVRAALPASSLRVTLAGDGPLRERLERRAAELGLGDVVAFAGALSHRELAAAYREADLVVVPSVTPEAFGRVALEAIAAGTPALVTNRGGLPEIVEEGVTGLVVEPDPAALAAGVLVALTSPTLHTRLQAAIGNVRRRFGVEVRRAHLALYEELVAARSAVGAPGTR